jgi:hypothetical protein
VTLNQEHPHLPRLVADERRRLAPDEPDVPQLIAQLQALIRRHPLADSIPLQAELVRLRRVCWRELIEPLPEDRPGGSEARLRQLERVRRGYPAWKNEHVAIAEELPVRDVSEARKGRRVA